MDLIPVPLFVINSLYDEYVLENILNVSCLTDHNSLENCSPKDLIKIDFLRSQTLTYLEKVKTMKPDSGAWAISCVLHVFSNKLETYSGVNY